MMTYDFLIVGAGFSGCILAERIATQLGKKVLLIDKRPHIAGNAYDSINEAGIRIHHYGPHLFHANDTRVVDYLSQFTQWHPYEHRVLSSVNGNLVPIPINRRTINELLGYDFQTDEDVRSFLEHERVQVDAVSNSEEFVISKVGRRLFDLLYKGYTQKHWGVDPAHLAPSVCGRLPVRTSTIDRYFDDAFQAMPREGYTAMFQKMIDHPDIELLLGTDLRSLRDIQFDKLIYTGPIDEYFDYRFGKLPYRSLRFEFLTYEKEYVQPVAQINYPNELPYTRTTEFKHITGQRHSQTTIAREYTLETGNPYYPIPKRENFSLYERYREAAQKLSSVYFAGRLALYQYYNMDQVTAQALSVFAAIVRG